MLVRDITVVPYYCGEFFCIRLIFPEIFLYLLKLFPNTSFISNISPFLYYISYLPPPYTGGELKKQLNEKPRIDLIFAQKFRFHYIIDIPESG